MLFRIAGLIILLAFISKAKCQENVTESEDKIVGGVVQQISNRKFQVAVTAGGGLCGGSLISLKWVLTAGHCVYKTDPTTMTVRAGSNHFNYGGKTRKVKSAHIRQDYNPNTLVNDIAMLLLKSPFIKSSTINTIARATSLPKDYSTLTVSGYGSTSEGGNVAKQLRSVAVELYPYKTCKDRYGSEMFDTMFCAGVPKGGKDSCQGDSGGPITHNGYLVGVVSWGNGCASAKYPGVYTRVPIYDGWIALIMKSY